MRAFSLLVELIVRFFMFLHKKLGINGILGFFLIIEILVMIAYVNNTRYDYLYATDAKLKSVTEFKQMDANDIPNAYKNHINVSDLCYQLTLEVVNDYVTDTYHPGIGVRDDSDYYISAKQLEYNIDLDDSTDLQFNAMVPAGKSAQVSYLVVIPKDRADSISELIIYSSYRDIDEKSEEKLVEEQHILRIPFNRDK